MALGLAIAIALAFSLTNGFLDAANAVATLVATRGAPPGGAIALSSAFNFLGALLLGTAVASTVAGIVSVEKGAAAAVIGSAALGAICWNLTMWSRGLPSSSGHALVGGLLGAAIANVGLGAVHWGGLNGLRPEGVLGVLIALALSPLIGLLLGAVAITVERAVLKRSTRRTKGPIMGSQWAMSAALSFSHGANDGQKGMGLIAALLVATGHLSTFSVPLWVKLAAATAISAGTSMGGWRIVRTIGRRILHLSPLDALASQSSSTAVIITFSLLGAPISSTHVVASSVIGTGAGRRRFAHIRWGVVGSIAFAWVVTVPAVSLLSAFILLIWQAI